MFTDGDIKQDTECESLLSKGHGITQKLMDNLKISDKFWVFFCLFSAIK